MRDETGWWLQTADEDLRTAMILLREGIYANAAFHLQQAGEKAMKALLAENGQRESTHSGMRLKYLLQERGIEIPEDLEHHLRKLDRCFADTRYPNGVGGPPHQFYDEKTVEDLVDSCKRVMEFVKSKLR